MHSFLLDSVTAKTVSMSMKDALIEVMCEDAEPADWLSALRYVALWEAN